MLRLLFSLIIFGGIAVAGLLYFDIIEFTPEGESLATQAEETLRNAAEQATEVIEGAVSE